jgi:general nucleoside transport system permease protein
VTSDALSRRMTESVLFPMIAVVLSLATGALLLLAVDVDPIDAYESMFSAAFGSQNSLSITIGKAIPRLMAALGIAIALRAGLWNIGAEGQIYVGATAATAVVLATEGLPFPVPLVLALLAGAVAGCLWAALPGVLRATRGVSEVITSLMLVYVAIQLTSYLLTGPWSVPGSTFPATEPFPSAARLPNIWPGTLLNAGAVIAVVSAVVAWFLMSRSAFGLRLRALGGGEQAARFAGVRVKRIIVLAMAVSGTFAGLAGAVEVLGVRGRLLEGFSPGYGFEAIAIALLGRLRVSGIVLAALLFAALDAGSTGLLTSGTDVPTSIVQILAAMSVIYVLMALGLNDLWIKRRRAREALSAARSESETRPTGLTEPARSA